MTYGVPYSFVPGTKAKADEVNANFIDVLEKIETVNSRVDTTNTTVETNADSVTAALEEKADLDLSNLSDTGNAKFTAKANTSDIDGNWVKSYLSLGSSKSIAKGATQTYSLSSYLPSGGIYEVILSVGAQTYNKAGAYSYLCITTDFMTTQVPFLKAITRADVVEHAAQMATIIVGTGRSLSVINNTNTSYNTTYDIGVYAYRKVR